MESTIWDKIAETSWWNFLIFAYLAWGAHSTLKPKLIKVTLFRNTGIMMAALMAIAFTYTRNSQTSYLITMTISATLIGFIIGWLQYHCKHISSSDSSGYVLVPGSWFGYLFLASFAYLYYRFDGTFIDPGFIKSHLYWIPTIYGFTCGLYLGKARYLYQHAPTYTTKASI